MTSFFADEAGGESVGVGTFPLGLAVPRCVVFGPAFETVIAGLVFGCGRLF